MKDELKSLSEKSGLHPSRTSFFRSDNLDAAIEVISASFVPDNKELEDLLQKALTQTCMSQRSE